MSVLSGPLVNEGVSSNFDDQNLLVVHKCQCCLSEVISSSRQ